MLKLTTESVTQIKSSMTRPSRPLDHFQGQYDLEAPQHSSNLSTLASAFESCGNDCTGYKALFSHINTDLSMNHTSWSNQCHLCQSGDRWYFIFSCWCNFWCIVTSCGNTCPLKLVAFCFAWDIFDKWATWNLKIPQSCHRFANYNNFRQYLQMQSKNWLSYEHDIYNSDDSALHKKGPQSCHVNDANWHHCNCCPGQYLSSS